MKSVNVLTATILVAIARVSIAEQGKTKSDLPEPVQKTADAQGAGATVVSYAKDVEKGNLEYEVQLMVAGHTKDLTIDPQGNLLEVEPCPIRARPTDAPVETYRVFEEVDLTPPSESS